MKYAQEWYPGHILEKRVEKRAVAETVFEEGEAEITCAGEDDGACKPNLEAVEEETVDGRTPAE